MAPYVEFPDAQTVAIVWLSARLAEHGIRVSGEPDGPDQLPTELPTVVVTALASPPMPNRFALAAARLYFEAIAPTQPDANRAANRANAHVRALAGQSVTTVDGVATVSTVRHCTTPESGDDTNTSYRTSGFSAELLLRPLRAT